MTIDAEIKAGMRRFIAERGQKVNFLKPYSWQNDDDRVNEYGWSDWEAYDHIRGARSGEGCSWIVPEGTVVKEKTYNQFADTDASYEYEVGLNAPGCRCACGKYQDVTLRVVCSLGEAIRGVLGYDPTTQLEL